MRYLNLLSVWLFFSVLTAFSQVPVKQTGITGDIFRYIDFPSKITDARNVDVWLPPNYTGDNGTKGFDANYEPYQRKADALMRRKRYKQGKNWITRKFVGDDHSEKSWRGRVAIPLTFFLAK